MLKRTILSIFICLAFATIALAAEQPRVQEATSDDFPHVARNQNRPAQMQFGGSANVCSAEYDSCDDDGGTGGGTGGGGAKPCVVNYKCSCGGSIFTCTGNCQAYEGRGCRYASATTCQGCNP